MSATEERASTMPRRDRRDDLVGLAFALVGVLFGVVLVGLGDDIQRGFGGMSVLAGALPVGYAFAAGMVATVNPCGVMLLPSLVAYSVGREEAAGGAGHGRLEQGVLRAVMATLGFVVIFAVVGLIFAAGGHALGQWFPVGGVIVGAALFLLGLWLALSGRAFGILGATRAMGHVTADQDLRSMFVFGIGYAVASLGCTLPVFLVVASLAMSAGNLLFAVSQFVSYALGMGLVLTVVIVAATFFQSAVRRWIRSLMPYVHRLAAAFLIGAGVYLVSYWLRAAGIL
ncbi:MAG: cytochrome c biogenesis CcdA family protein [Chloroflexota bacterium]